MSQRIMIIRNRARCKKCGVEVESLSRHDYVSCPCGNLAVDGGGDYLKRSTTGADPFEELSTAFCSDGRKLKIGPEGVWVEDAEAPPTSGV